MRQIFTNGQLMSELIEHFHMFEHNGAPIYEVTLVERTKLSKKLFELDPISAMRCHLEQVRDLVLIRIKSEERYLDSLKEMTKDLCPKS